MQLKHFAGFSGADVPELLVGQDIGADAAPLLRKRLGDRFITIGDARTRPLLPFPGAPCMQLPGEPGADDVTAASVIAFAREASATGIVAVGSGTINDLCKYAAHALELPYAVVATAPSMNGYASANASISIGGYKSTLSCRPPCMILADLKILANAPRRLIGAGFADAFCRSCVQRDWLLSHLLLDTPYDASLFQLQAGHETSLAAAPENIRNGHPEAMAMLLEWLILGGLVMNRAGGSQPASQGEHLIAHAISMIYGERGYHGEQVAVATATMARQQEALLTWDKAPGIRRLSSAVEGKLVRCLGEERAAEAVAQHRGKLPDEATVQRLEQRLAVHWPAWREQLRKAGRPAVETVRILEEAGTATAPDTLGLSGEEYAAAVELAPFLRNRFTFLDLC